MNFEAYLENTRKTADEEKHILDILSAKNVLSPIEIRAAKSALQTLIADISYREVVIHRIENYTP